MSFRRAFNRSEIARGRRDSPRWKRNFRATTERDCDTSIVVADDSDSLLSYLGSFCYKKICTYHARARGRERERKIATSRRSLPTSREPRSSWVFHQIPPYLVPTRRARRKVALTQPAAEFYTAERQSASLKSVIKPRSNGRLPLCRTRMSSATRPFLASLSRARFERSQIILRDGSLFVISRAA